jgi:heme-degrading monooxygenase HmoA
MIARVGTFEGLSAEAAAESERNLHERFMPALRAQAGFVLGLWLEGEDGKVLSITVWESAEAMATGAHRANTTPLLAGQDPEKIPSPNVVEYFKVNAHADRHVEAKAHAPEARSGS